MKKNRLNLLCMILFLGATLTLGADDPKPRKAELAAALAPLQWQPPPPADMDHDTSPNPGWYNPRNREALAKFVAKYPDTEEAYLAEVWLIFAKADAERSRDISDLKRRRAEDGQALKRVIMKTATPGTAKIAKILRASVLLDADERAELKVQVDEILSTMHEYETETDEQFLRFVKLTERPASEFEPYLRRMRVISACHQGHLKEALVLAEELQAKYPAWSKRELIHSDISMLKLGKSPYPTWEQLKKAGPSLEEFKKRSRNNRQN